MTAFAVIRATTTKNVDNTIRNLLNNGKMDFDDEPRELDPEYADDILVSVLNSKLKNKCEVAAIISLKGNPSEIIKKLKLIPSPAHIIIVTPRHEIYEQLEKDYNTLPEIFERNDQL